MRVKVGTIDDGRGAACDWAVGNKHLRDESIAVDQTQRLQSGNLAAGIGIVLGRQEIDDKTSARVVECVGRYLQGVQTLIRQRTREAGRSSRGLAHDTILRKERSSDLNGAKSARQCIHIDEVFTTEHNFLSSIGLCLLRIKGVQLGLPVERVHTGTTFFLSAHDLRIMHIKCHGEKSFTRNATGRSGASNYAARNHFSVLEISRAKHAPVAVIPSGKAVAVQVQHGTTHCRAPPRVVMYHVE